MITDLPGSHIGASTNDGKILIDKNAAGHGWFVDLTPLGDSEFQRRTESEYLALDNTEADDRADLLTVVMHEMGNQLGLSDLTDPTDGRLLTWVLDLGVRRVPISQDAMLANFLFLYPQGRRRW